MSRLARSLFSIGLAVAAGVAGFQAVVNVQLAFAMTGPAGWWLAGFAGLCGLGCVAASREFYRSLP